MNLLLGDCLETMKTLADNSVHACVTDPPYGLAFMNKKWDYDVPSREVWAQVFRVMKPGAHLLSFGGTRTYHRMVVTIEDAGFEIRDQVMWIYGSGFPKSLDVSKAIDKAAGATREVVGRRTDRASAPIRDNRGGNYNSAHGKGPLDISAITAPATPEANLWQGWGTALKPANEPIVLARKPLEKGLTVAANVLKWGTGAINVDAGRIGSEVETWPKTRAVPKNGFNMEFGNTEKETKTAETGPAPQGRWPANVLFDEEAAAVLDEQSGTLKTGGPKYEDSHQEHHMFKGGRPDSHRAGDSGGASRFFYVAKTSKRERNAGLEGMPLGEPPKSARSIPAEGRETALGLPLANHHPTVKPIKLMEYLCNLITPPGGVILDPFMGSGSTGCAARALGFDFIGCEMSPEYMEIAKRRIEHWAVLDDQMELPA